MAIAELSAEKREKVGKITCAHLRAEGKVPGILYGKDEPNIPIAVSAHEFERAAIHGVRMFKLNLGGAMRDVIVKEVQHDSFGREIIHVDFDSIRADRVLRIDVEVVLKGTAEGSKVGGRVEQEVYMITVECLPKDIPEKIEVDITNLQLDGIVHVSNMPALPGIKYLLPAQTAVITCHTPRGEEAAAAPTAVEGASTEPEVIGRKKEDEEEGAEDAKGGKAEKPAKEDKKK